MICVASLHTFSVFLALHHDYAHFYTASVAPLEALRLTNNSP